MKSIELNVRGTDQRMVIEKTDGGLNPSNSMTVEALCQLLGDGQDPTIFSLPAGENWETPFVAWRLGFHGKGRLPEFQVTIEEDREPTTARSLKSVRLGEVVQLAGTYDGSAVRLYVNGRLDAEVAKTGRVLQSRQRATFGARSSTALGGLFVGHLFEMRFWDVVRSISEIETWKDKSLPIVPKPSGLRGLWKAAASVGPEVAQHLASRGISPIEISFSSFVGAYVEAYSTVAPEILSGVAKEQFAQRIHVTMIGSASDGHIVFYEPAPSDLLAGITGGDTERTASGGYVQIDWKQHTLSDVLQMMSGNAIKVCTPGKRGARSLEIPEDRNDTVATSVNPRLKQAGIAPPQIHIVKDARRAGDGAHLGGRLRIISPLVALEGGDVVRVFPWLFVDIWFGELSWEIATIGLADLLALNDILGLDVIVGGRPSPSPSVIEVGADQPLLPLKKLIAEFEALIAKEDVDEVRDVLPFLGKTQHWVILSPTAQYVWPEKMLGNKWRVDFVVKESDGTYTAIEVESPKKPLYKTGQAVEPYAMWTHAEQQVRDYCNFIDMNRDYVEREEGLAGILRPRGLVIIGRRNSLTDEGRKKLAERNTDNGRYQTITFDDLLDQAKAVVQRLMALIAPRHT